MLKRIVLAASASALCLNQASAVDVCDCDGPVIDNKCYNDLEDAIDNANGGDTLMIGNDQWVYSQIEFEKSLSFEGINCEGRKPRVYSDINSKIKGIFFVGGDNGEVKQSLSFTNLRFERTGKNSRFLRTRESHKWMEDRDKHIPYSGHAPISAYFSDCDILNFKSKSKVRGGSAISIDTVGDFEMYNTVVKGNVNDMDEEDLYGGGGAIWIQDVPKNSNIKMDGVKCEDNHHKHFHALGGCMKVGKVGGSVYITNSLFKDNIATDGGAIHVARIERGADVTITDSNRFIGNTVQAIGARARGAALRFKFIKGNLYVGGYFENNNAYNDGRAVIANNRFSKSASISIGGEFVDNYVDNGASIWDTSMDGATDRLVIRKGTKIVNTKSGSYSNALLHIQLKEYGYNYLVNDKNKKDKLSMSDDGTLYEDFLASL